MSTAQEKHRISEIEERLKKVSHTLEGLMPIWTQVDRRVRELDSERMRLEDERIKLQQGQLSLTFDDFNF